jgi:hypothetical protein
MSEPIKAVRAEVNLGESVVIDGYMLPNGEFRYGLTRTSLLLGYAKQWLSPAQPIVEKALASPNAIFKTRVLTVISLYG